MTTLRMAEAVLGREARRIFRKLLAPQAFIAARAEGGFGVFPSAKAKHHSLAVDPELLRECLARDWLRGRGTEPERFVLSPAGEGWYARATAASEPFAAQHQVRSDITLETADGRQRVTRNEGESPLGWLRQRKVIDASQFEAGERLRRDYTLAQLSPRMGVDLSAPILGGRRGMKSQAPLSETVLAAKQRFRAAMLAAGPGLADVLFDICCHLTGLEEIEQAKNWPRRSAKVVLDIALNRLALHYGLRITASGRARTRSWRADGE